MYYLIGGLLLILAYVLTLAALGATLLIIATWKPKPWPNPFFEETKRRKMRKWANDSTFALWVESYPLWDHNEEE